jgi:hypothetical protein
VAKSIVVTAAFGRHEGAFAAFSNGLTNHGNHPPFKLVMHKKMARLMPHPAIVVQLCRHGYKQREGACQGKYPIPV